MACSQCYRYWETPCPKCVPDWDKMAEEDDRLYWNGDMEKKWECSCGVNDYYEPLYDTGDHETGYLIGINCDNCGRKWSCEDGRGEWTEDISRVSAMV